MYKAEAEDFRDAPKGKSSRILIRIEARAMERPRVAAAAKHEAKAARAGNIDGPDQKMRRGTARPYMSRCANPSWIAPHRDGWPLKGCA